MSFTTIPNMPVVFNEGVEACACIPEWNQLSQFNDTIQFQLNIAPNAGAAQILGDPTFRVDTDLDSALGWKVSGSFSGNGKGLMCKDADGTQGTFGQFDVFTIGNLYQVTVNVQQIFGTLEVFNGGFKVGEVTAIGLSKFVFEAKSPNLTFQMVGNFGYDSCCITSVTAYDMEEILAFTILDEAGAFSTIYTYSSNPELFTFAKGTVTVTFKWSDLSISTDGCYRIGVADPNLNTNAQFGVTNPTFTNYEIRNDYGAAAYPVGWYETGTRYVNRFMLWSTSPSTPHMSLYVSGGSTTAGTSTFSDLGCVLGTGLTYDVTLQIVSLNSQIVVKAGTASSATYSATGTYNFQITAAGSSPLLAVQWTPTNLSSSIMDVYQLVVTLANDSDWHWDLTSNTFKLATEHSCTKLLNISQDDDAFGAVFEGSNFAPRFRAECQLVNSGYSFSREVNHTSDGTKKVFFGERRKTKFLKLEQLPTYLHDFLSLAVIADYFFIDGTQYFVEDEEYSPDFPESITELAKVQMEVSEVTQNIVNTDVGNTPNPIAVTPADEDNLIGYPPSVQSDTVIEWSTGTKILIP